MEAIFGTLLIIAGFGFVFLSFYIKYRLKKYEFENRTDGGVVLFKSFGASIGHKYSKSGAGWLRLIGGLSVLAGIFYLGVGVENAGKTQSKQVAAHASKNKLNKD
jgi:hypothetical protein